MVGWSSLIYVESSATRAPPSLRFENSCVTDCFQALVGHSFMHHKVPVLYHLKVHLVRNSSCSSRMRNKVGSLHER
ncbi:hypothetical protein J5N97_022576 [Dioscorea zingiberensis]|uniref:Uncharacterized protein n=1 Tax=Dioscorea zingiberensis TaxID=325984 RepID=A0A9D5CB72_9LILI|nr:hypothetical protein J5N97_022576 [Dioscorea zingiberensis]